MYYFIRSVSIYIYVYKYKCLYIYIQTHTLLSYYKNQTDILNYNVQTLNIKIFIFLSKYMYYHSHFSFYYSTQNLMSLSSEQIHEEYSFMAIKNVSNLSTFSTFSAFNYSHIYTFNQTQSQFVFSLCRCCYKGIRILYLLWI